MKKLKTWALYATFGFLVALMSLQAADAAAPQFVYLADDEAAQKRGDNYEWPENYVGVFWGLYPWNEVYWKADPEIQSEAWTAVYNWESQFPQLKWVQSQSDFAHVRFTAPQEGCGGEIARVYLYNVDNPHYYDPARLANYWLYATVCVDTDVQWAPGGIVSALAHEIGHLYGLHDRYYGPVPPTCNPNEHTIMDTYIRQEPYAHCDGLQGPALQDSQRVHLYYHTGDYLNFTAERDPDDLSVGEWQWQDASWAEERHQMQWYWWTGSQWIQYTQDHIRHHTGSHIDIEYPGYQDPSRTIDREDYPPPQGPPWPTWHIACGDAWFAAWGTTGTWRCSNCVYLY